MDLRSRDRDRSGGGGVHDVREDILLETNFDEDGALTMAHTTNSPYPYQSGGIKSTSKSHANNENPLLQRNLNARRSYYRSDTSIDRYSEYSLHGRREPGSLAQSKQSITKKKQNTTDQIRQLFLAKCDVMRF